jgi:hypothetical protein
VPLNRLKWEAGVVSVRFQMGDRNGLEEIEWRVGVLLKVHVAGEEGGRGGSLRLVVCIYLRDAVEYCTWAHMRVCGHICVYAGIFACTRAHMRVRGRICVYAGIFACTQGKGVWGPRHEIS